ncbi:unnamed protein product [Trichobilharzia regenti]|nr:unnamed protein product [Trichobilharzia regenti]
MSKIPIFFIHQVYANKKHKGESWSDRPCGGSNFGSGHFFGSGNDNSSQEKRSNGSMPGTRGRFAPRGMHDNNNNNNSGFHRGGYANREQRPSSSNTRDACLACLNSPIRTESINPVDINTEHTLVDYQNSEFPRFSRRFSTHFSGRNTPHMNWNLSEFSYQNANSNVLMMTSPPVAYNNQSDHYFTNLKCEHSIYPNYMDFTRNIIDSEGNANLIPSWISSSTAAAKPRDNLYFQSTDSDGVAGVGSDGHKIATVHSNTNNLSLTPNSLPITPQPDKSLEDSYQLINSKQKIVFPTTIINEDYSMCTPSSSTAPLAATITTTTPTTTSTTTRQTDYNQPIELCSYGSSDRSLKASTVKSESTSNWKYSTSFHEMSKCQQYENSSTAYFNEDGIKRQTTVNLPISSEYHSNSHLKLKSNDDQMLLHLNKPAIDNEHLNEMSTATNCFDLPKKWKIEDTMMPLKNNNNKIIHDNHRKQFNELLEESSLEVNKIKQISNSDNNHTTNNSSTVVNKLWDSESATASSGIGSGVTTNTGSDNNNSNDHIRHNPRKPIHSHKSNSNQNNRHNNDNSVNNASNPNTHDQIPKTPHRNHNPRSNSSSSGLYESSFNTDIHNTNDTISNAVPSQTYISPYSLQNSNGLTHSICNCLQGQQQQQSLGNHQQQNHRQEDNLHQTICHEQIITDPALIDMHTPSQLDLEQLSSTSSQVSSGVGSMSSSNAGSGYNNGTNTNIDKGKTNMENSGNFTNNNNYNGNNNNINNNLLHMSTLPRPVHQSGDYNEDNVTKMWRKYHKPYHDYQSEYNQCTKLYSEEFSSSVSRSTVNNAQYSTSTSQSTSSSSIHPYSLPQSHSQNNLNSITPNSLYNRQMDLCFPLNAISSSAYSSFTSNRPHSVELFSHVNSDLRGRRRERGDATDDHREYTQNFHRNDDVITESNNSCSSNMIIQRVSATTDRCHLNEAWFGNTTSNNNNNNDNNKSNNNNNNSYWSNPYYTDLAYMSTPDTGPTWLDKSMTTPVASSTSSCIPTGFADYNKQTSCYPLTSNSIPVNHNQTSLTSTSIEASSSTSTISSGKLRSSLPFWSENSHLQDSNLYNIHNPYVQCSQTIATPNATSMNNINNNNNNNISTSGIISSQRNRNTDVNYSYPTFQHNSSSESENLSNHHNSLLLPLSTESIAPTSSAQNTPYSSNHLTMNEVSQRCSEQMNNINPLNIPPHQLTGNYQNSFDQQVQNIPSVVNSSIHTYINSFHSSNLLYSPFLQSVFDEQTTPISSSTQPQPPPSSSSSSSVFPSPTTNHLGQYDQFFVNANPISNNLVVCSMSSMDTDCIPFHSCN